MNEYFQMIMCLPRSDWDDCFVNVEGGVYMQLLKMHFYLLVITVMDNVFVWRLGMVSQESLLLFLPLTHHHHIAVLELVVSFKAIP